MATLQAPQWHSDVRASSIESKFSSYLIRPHAQPPFNSGILLQKSDEINAQSTYRAAYKDKFKGLASALDGSHLDIISRTYAHAIDCES